jgi:hypothetical protein
LNPKALDRRIKPNELYIIDHNNNTSNEDNAENSDGTMNVIESWGENGTIVELINIATNIDEPVTTKAYVDG